MSLLLVLLSVSIVRGQADAPTDQEIAAAIARGVAFLKHAQSREGHWNEPAQPQHRLGMTALAGLALLENGVRPRLRARSARRASSSPSSARVGSNVRHRAGDPVSGAMSARTARRVGHA